MSDFDVDKALAPSSDFDVDAAIAPPKPTTTAVLESTPLTAAGILQTAIGGGIRATGDLFRSSTVEEAGAGIAESGEINVQRARPVGMSLGQEFLHGGVANVGAMAPALAAGAIGGVPAVLGGAGALAFGPTYHKSREAGLSGGRSFTHGAIDSAIEIGTELLPAKYLFGEAGKPILRRLRNALISDYGGEVAATILQNLNAKASYNPEMSVREMVNDVIQTMGSTLVSSPLTAGFGLGMSGLVRAGRKLQAKAGYDPDSPLPYVPEVDTTGAISPGIPAQNPPDVRLAPAQAPVADPTEIEVEPDVVKSRWVQEHADSAGYLDEGQRIMKLPPGKRPVVFNAKGEEDSTTFDKFEATPGDVVVLGPLWEGHTAEYMQLLQQEGQQFNKEVLGNKAVIVLTTGLPKNPSGVAASAFLEDGAPVVFINPRHLYDSMLERKEQGKSSMHAEAEAQYSLYHEFGHAVRQLAMQNSSDAKQQAVEADFRAAAESVADRSLKATDFLLKYSSPWKVAKGFALDDYGGEKGDWSAQSAERFVQYVMGKAKFPDPRMKVEHVSALTFLETLAKRAGYKDWTAVFNIDEYVAEQHARWMRSTKRAITSPLGQYFSDMNELMNKYFNWLVRSKRVGKPSDLGPSEAYKKFLSAMIRSNKRISESVVATPEMIKMKGLNPRKLFYDLDGTNDLPDRAGLTEEESLKLPVIALANRWRRKYGETQSPFFLMWGGNWRLGQQLNALRRADKRNDDYVVGVVRQEMAEGRAKLLEAKLDAIRLKNDRIVAEIDKLLAEYPKATRLEDIDVSLLVDVYGNPLVVYHGTWSSFDRFTRTRDIGFHFGTQRAAHDRLGIAADPTDAYIDAVREGYQGMGMVFMPHFLQTGKSLTLPDLGTWTPSQLLYNISTTVQLSNEDHTSLAAELERRMKKDETEIPFVDGVPVRRSTAHNFLKELLDYLGYQSITYTNNVEDPGSESYIVFEGPQVKSALGNQGTFSRSTNIFYDTTSAAAIGDEEPLRNLGKNTNIDIKPLIEAGKTIRKKWWLLEQLRKVGVDLGTFEMNLQQWQHIAQRLPGIPYVQRFVDLSRLFTEEKNLNVKFSSETVVNGYKQLGKTQLTQLRQVMDWEATEGAHQTQVMDGYLPDGRPAKLRVIPDRAMFANTIKEKLGFVPDAYVMDYYEQIRTAMHNQLVSLYNAAAEKTGVTADMGDLLMGEFGDLLVDSKAEDLQQLQQLLDKPQYPWSRFGKYAIVIEQEQLDEKGKKSNVPVHYRHFEFESDRDKAYNQLRLDPGQRGRVYNYYDDYAGFSVIPQSFVESVIRRAGFDPNSPDADQIRQLASIQRNTNLFKRFEEDFRLADRTESDVLKDFADFAGHLASLTAKVKYRRHLSLTLAEGKRSVAALDAQGVNSADLQQLNHYLSQQLEYGMQPQDELQALRSFVTKAMLFGNVRAAAINSTAMLNTAAYLDGLVSKYNVLSWPSLLPLVKSAIQAVGSTHTVLDRLSAEEKSFLQDIEGRGVTDQSYSYHLAAAADSGIFYRLNRSKSKWGTKIVETGMLPFRAMERYTRRVGALTAYRMAKAYPEITENKTPEQFAKEALYLTQADYTAFNRPRSQQGLRAAALIFFTYTQHMTALFGGTLGGATAARLFIIYTMLGGLMGLPFAEDIMNLSNWVWRRLFKGEQDLRVAAQEVANEIPLIGHALLRGVTHNIGGFDLSHSVSMGRVIPGMDSFAQSNMKSVDESFGSFAFDLMGPLGGYARGWLQAGAAMIEDPSVQSAIRVGQAAMPAQRSAFDLALFAAQSGDPATVQGYAGQIITKEEDGTIRPLDVTELVGKALGFNPRIVSRNREIDFLQREISTFWTQRRKHYLDTYWQAVQLRDPEMRADARDAIREFNQNVPDRALKIHYEDISRSVKQRERIRKLEQEGKAPNRRFRTLYSDVEETFTGG